MSIPILSTKFFIPTSRSTVVPRIQLIDRIQRGLSRRLTLISAPAGFGKTTLLADCVGKIKEPVGWISLDEQDNDKVRFLKYFINAIQQIEKGIGDNSLLALQSQQPLETEILVTGLINDIADINHPFVVVLDDYHVITDTEIQQILLFLLDNQPPQMHMVISSRADPPWPLARLRARGEIEEIRIQDLRFTLDEAAILLNEIMGFTLSSKDLAALEKRTEGWVAGLQMAAIALQNQQDKASYIQAFTGSHRYIFDYLMEEVLNSVPDDAREFLLRTSILDRFNGSLCDFVIEKENSQSILMDLEHKNIFLIPLDSRQNWYRYHHLFAELLRNQLNHEKAGLAAQLHKRASMWFEQRGIIDTAVNHAVATKDFEFAADIVERNVADVKDSGDLPMIGNWLQKFPDETVFNHSWLCIAKAWVLIYLGQAEDAMMILERAEQSLLNGKEKNIRGHIAAIRCYHYLFESNLPLSIDHGYKALKLIGETDLSTRISAATSLASALRLSGDLETARVILAEAVGLSKKTDHKQTTVRLLCGLSALQIYQGQLPNAYSTLQEAIQIGQWIDDGKQSIPMPVTGHAYLRLAQVLTDMNQLEDALEYVQLGIRLCKKWGQANALWEGYLALADIHKARGNTKESHEAFLEAEKISNRISAVHIERITNALKAQFWLDTGQVDVAVRWAEKNDLRSDKQLQFQDISWYNILANILIAQKRYQEAQTLLSQMIDISENSGAFGLSLLSMVRLSLVHEHQGADKRAIETLTQALELGQSSGYLRVFIEQGEQLLGLLRKVLSKGIQVEYTTKLIHAIEAELPKLKLRKPASDDLTERLSDREIEVLRYLNSNLTIPEISSHLHVSVSTLRTHIRNIYEKLGVHSRFEATTKAKDLKLI